MKHLTQPTNEMSGAKWQLLGETKLPVGSGAEESLQPWLVETLRHLNLNAGFLNKILASAQLSAENAMQAAAANQHEHIHLLFFATPFTLASGQNWGFFRVEKVESRPAGKGLPDHSIEFYLYREGR